MFQDWKWDLEDRTGSHFSVQGKGGKGKKTTYLKCHRAGELDLKADEETKRAGRVLHMQEACTAHIKVGRVGIGKGCKGTREARHGQQWDEKPTNRGHALQVRMSEDGKWCVSYCDDHLAHAIQPGLAPLTPAHQNRIIALIKEGFTTKVRTRGGLKPSMGLR